jgi:cation diffusion facilitator CzcD-associated flavoprotein CzcO
VRLPVIAGAVAVVTALAVTGAATYLARRSPADPQAARTKASVEAIEAVRAQLKRPDSMHVTAVLANADGSVACVLYDVADPSAVLGRARYLAARAHGRLDAAGDLGRHDPHCDDRDVAFKMDDVAAAANGPLKLATP